MSQSAFHIEQRVGDPPRERPLMIFDGDCNFCRHWIARWQEATGERVEYREFQKVAERFPEIPRAAFENAVQLVEPDGRVTSGADAVFRVLEFSPRKKWAPLFFRALPFLMPSARFAYKFVAQHRALFSALTKIFFGKNFSRPRYLLARWLFVRALGFVYFVAFVSLAVQIRGLTGKRGILPAQQFFDAATRQLGAKKFWLLPSVCWLNTSDGFLVFLCWLGAALALLTMLGFWPSACFAAMWLAYLSLSVAGRVFLNYQWDALLLETGLLAIFLMPPLAIFPRWHRESRTEKWARWLLLWLAFRLTFESGIVKLASGDPTWRNLTALAYHYETQPLPLWTAWYANQSPTWLLKTSCGVMFAIELLAPFSIFGPRNIRRAGALAMIALQISIGATGNYTFFNLLTAALYLLMLDDDFFPQSWRGFVRERAAQGSFFQKLIAGERGAWPRAIVAPFAAIDALLTGALLLATARVPFDWPRPLEKLYTWLAPFRSFNGYGLFAVMTTSRPEIIIEGSNDGVTWLPYEFKWKAGDVYTRPRLCEPHQPRLDWQMWFAALEGIDGAPWVYNFLARLLEGSPDVLALLAHDPFPEKPPRYIRAQLYDYHFTRRADKTAAWWKRELRGAYCQPLSLRAAEESFSLKAD